MLDTTRRVATPEGIELTLRLRRPGAARARLVGRLPAARRRGVRRDDGRRAARRTPAPASPSSPRSSSNGCCRPGSRPTGTGRRRASAPSASPSERRRHAGALAGGADPQPAARGRFPAAVLRHRPGGDARQPRLQAPRRPRRRHGGGLPGEESASAARLPEAPPVAPPFALSLEEQRAVLELAERASSADARAPRGARRAARAAGRQPRRQPRRRAPDRHGQLHRRAARNEAAPVRGSAREGMGRVRGFLDERRKKSPFDPRGDAAALPPHLPEPRARRRPPVQPGAGRPPEPASRCAATMRSTATAAASRSACSSSCSPASRRWCAPSGAWSLAASLLFFGPLLGLIAVLQAYPEFVHYLLAPEQIAQLPQDVRPGEQAPRHAARPTPA